MDIKSPRKRHDGKFPKPSVVSPVKDHGKISLGFRGFKIINSNIRLVKQVDVRTPILKPKASPELTSLPVSPPSSTPPKKLTTAESLKKLREKVLLKKKQHEELFANDAEKETIVEDTNYVIPNGVHVGTIEALPHKDPVKPSESETQDKMELEDRVTEIPEAAESTDSHSSKKMTTSSASLKSDKPEHVSLSPTKDRKERLEKKHSTERTEKKSRSDSSSSSRSHPHKHDSSYRKNRERSRSPRRDIEHRHSKSTSHHSSNVRSRSPHRDRESYSSNKGGSSRRSSHHSRRREPMYVRKYSVSQGSSRNNESSKLHSHSRGHHDEKGKSHGEDDNHRRRSSSHHRASSERSNSSRGKLSTEARSTSTTHKEKTKSSRPCQSDERTKHVEKKIDHSLENRKPLNPNELFSKLSFSLLNEEEEQFEEEVDNALPKEKQYDSEAIDTDHESFHTINDTESSEVDTACEDELPLAKIIDEVGKDTADINSVEQEQDDATSNDLASSIQDATEENAVNPSIESSESQRIIESLEQINDKPLETCVEVPSDYANKRTKVTESTDQVAKPTVVSLETKCDISCESIEPLSVPVENEFKIEREILELKSSPVNAMARNFDTVPHSPAEHHASQETGKIVANSRVQVTFTNGMMSPPSAVTEASKISETLGSLPKKEADLDNAKCRSSQSEKSPVKLTTYAKDSSSICPPMVVMSNGLAEPLKTVTEQVLSPENKIHAMGSQLKDVFKSLLQTDFKADDETKIANVAKLNGVISHNRTKLPELDGVEGNKQFFSGVTEGFDDTTESTEDVATKELHSISDDSSFAEKGTVRDEARMSPELDSYNALNDCATLPITPTRLHSSNAFTVISPEKGTKPSPHKLKLHATTRTPLPAKKSYIQQVKSGKNNSEADSTDHGVLAARLMDPSDGEMGLVPSSSDAEIQESKQSVISTSLAGDNLALDSDSHCETNREAESQKILSSVQDLALSRQDSSGSSGNDNEEGPRRSARIRTKKTERSLKKQVSTENNGQKLPTVDDTSDITKPMQTTIESRVDLVERLPDNLSGEELFKARINVAQDTTDCPEPFELLEENLYLTSMKKSRARKEIRRMVCDCATEDAADPGGPCGENCLNRLLMIECSSRCHYGNKCTNKRFQQQRYAPSEVFKTNFKGWGIRAAADIEQGELVMEYCGEVVDQREFTRRSLEYSKSNHAHFYFMALSQDEVIDATYKGNSSRFINHSCDPNAETQKWTVNGRLRVGFFTLRRIEKGEEITFDYQFERYGKVAQKCFCGTAKCRGYLGKAPNEDGEEETKLSKLLSNEALSPLNDTSDDSPEKTQQKKKKLEYFPDITMEKDISKLLGGLRSTKEVLALSRLMVRCDTHTQRIMCLRVLKETTSQTRLKSFLQFHGLSIIWSWMVDISGVEDEESLALKLEIINTLCILPITNKNVIEDSKVLSVVQRWAKPETKQHSTSQEDNSPKEEETIAAKEIQDGDILSETDGVKEIDSETQDPKVTIKLVEDVDTKSEETHKEPASTEDVLNTQSNENEPIKTNENVLFAAASLLDSWKDLREIYRIPKRQKPLPSPNQDSSSRDNSLSRNSSPLPKLSRFDDSEQRASRVGHSRRGSSQERWRDSSDRLWDYKYKDKRTDFTDNQFSPGSSNSGENKKEVGRRKRRFSTDSDEISKELPWHSRAPRNNFKMSRQEYRRRFEKDVEKREQEKKRMEEQMEAEIAQSAMFPVQTQQFIGGVTEEIQPLMSQDLSMIGQPMSGGATFTPSGFSGNLIQINPTQPAPIMVDPYLNVTTGQQVSVIHQVIQQPQNPYSVPIQQSYEVSGMYSQDPNLQPGMYSISDPTMVTQQHINHAGQQIFTTNSINVVQPQMQQQQQQPQPQPTVIQPQSLQSNNNVTILGSQNGQAIVLLSAEQLQKLTQGDLSVLKESVQGKSSVGKNSSDGNQEGTSDTKKSKEPKEPKLPTQLPPNWKTATDNEGRVYYYHAITRQTQWDPPTWDGKEEDLLGKKEAENMDLSSTPTHDERWAKSSKHKNDGVTEEGRKAKETFRLKMSQFVVHCLSSYRKPDKKVGRITSTEDFKHLARKLTHNVMEKELKQVRVFEDLDFNANVKHKTKEYVKKYMGKVGPIYKIKDDT